MASLTDFGFPFNSVTSDRTYNADVWRDYFKNLFTNGVVPNKLNELAVTESDTPAKSVKVGTGFVIIQGVQYGIETAQTLAITDNASGDDRIDRVVARLDYTNRTAELDILQGTPSATPSAPVLTQNATTYEISLAQVYVSNGFTTILNANITDERAFAKVNVIFDADFLNSQSPSYYLARTNHTGTQLASTISNFASTVRSTVLTGLSTATNAVISTADSLLTALGKLQAQITATKNTAENHISSTSNPHSVDKADVGLGSVANYGIATQAEAEAGTSNTDYMTPLRTKEAINANGFVLGTYTGNGNISQTINVGFTPSVVIISSPLGSFLFPGLSGINYSGIIYGGMITTNTLSGSTSAGEITTNGFIVYMDGSVYTNRNGDTFSYMAYK